MSALFASGYHFFPIRSVRDVISDGLFVPASTHLAYALAVLYLEQTPRDLVSM